VSNAIATPSSAVDAGAVPIGRSTPPSQSRGVAPPLTVCQSVGSLRDPTPHSHFATSQFSFVDRCNAESRMRRLNWAWGGGPDDRMVKAEAKAGSAPIRDDRRWSGGAFTKIQPRASVECARRCSWPAFPHTCTLAYTHAYTAPTGPLHHTDRSPTPHRPVPYTTPTGPRGVHTRVFAAAHPACPSCAQVLSPAERFLSRSLRRRIHCPRCSKAVLSTVALTTRCRRNRRGSDAGGRTGRFNGVLRDGA